MLRSNVSTLNFDRAGIVDLRVSSYRTSLAVMVALTTGGSDAHIPCMQDLRLSAIGAYLEGEIAFEATIFAFTNPTYSTAW